MSLKIAFVIPWFHWDIAGGAEALCRDTAVRLQQAGHDVTLLITCIRDHASDWNVNYFPEGEANEGDLRVIRFNADVIDRQRFAEINARYIAMNESQKYRLPPPDEEYFFRRMAPSHTLLSYAASHKHHYDFFFFLPYLFYPAIYGTSLCGVKSVLIPCLHDEGYAYARPVAASLSCAGGLIFNTHAEQQLARKIAPIEHKRQEVIGTCISIPDCLGNGEDFRTQFNIRDPFILYAGRRDNTKRVDILISYFLEYKKTRETRIKLVLIGPEQVDTFGSQEIIDLGFVSAKDKYDAFAACSWFCNPSFNESFSISLLEAWANRKAVLVAAHCAPTRDFCARSNGGLWFTDLAEFFEALDYLTARPDVCARLGENGFAFVERGYSHQSIMQKYNRLLEEWKSQ